MVSLEVAGLRMILEECLVQLAFTVELATLCSNCLGTLKRNQLGNEGQI